MRSFFANLRTLVLPAGQVQGRRIVLDGVNGRIDIYDDTDTLVARLDDNGLHLILDDGDVYITEDLGVYVAGNDGSGVEIRTDGAGAALLSAIPKTLPGSSFFATVLATRIAGATNVPYLQIASASYMTPVARAFAQLLLFSEDTAGNPPYLQTDQPIRDTAGVALLKGQQGTEVCNVAAASTFTQAVAFPVPFATGSNPQVQLNFRTNPANSARWAVRATGITETGFTINMRNIENPAVASTFAVNVGWTATVAG